MILRDTIGQWDRGLADGRHISGMAGIMRTERLDELDLGRCREVLRVTWSLDSLAGFPEPHFAERHVSFSTRKVKAKLLHSCHIQGNKLRCIVASDHLVHYPTSISLGGHDDILTNRGGIRVVWSHHKGKFAVCPAKVIDHKSRIGLADEAALAGLEYESALVVKLGDGDLLR